MNDLVPGDKVIVRCGRPHGRWCDKPGTVTWASDGHGRDREYDVRFEDAALGADTFMASELIEIEREPVVSDTLLAPAGPRSVLDDSARPGSGVHLSDNEALHRLGQSARAMGAPGEQ